MPCAPPMSARSRSGCGSSPKSPPAPASAARSRAGEAARIFTGAPLPDGADTIVIQEDTERRGDHVEVKEGAARGRYVRPAGLDFAEGDVLLHKGRRLTPRDIGLAAAMNRPWLLVHRRPRVAILSTGDEVVMPGDPIGPHQIVSSNALALAAFVTASGGVPVLVGNAPDDPDALRRIAAAAKGVDLFVTTGGVSVGEHDLVRDVLGADGLDIDFWEIAMRPGKPLMFGHYRGTPMIGLPGNPVSTLVCSLLFLKPAIERLSGLPATAEPPLTARLAVAVRQNDRRQDYLRARLVRAADGVARSGAVRGAGQLDDASLGRLRLPGGAPAARPAARRRQRGADHPVHRRRAAALGVRPATTMTPLRRRVWLVALWLYALAAGRRRHGASCRAASGRPRLAGALPYCRGGLGRAVLAARSRRAAAACALTARPRVIGFREASLPPRTMRTTTPR